MQSCNHQNAKLQPSKCKVASFGTQSYKKWDAISNIFDFNLMYLLIVNSSLSTERLSPKTAYLYSLSVYLCKNGPLLKFQMLN